MRKTPETAKFYYIVAWLDGKPKVQHACENESISIDQVSRLRRHPRGDEYVFVVQKDMTRDQMERMTSPPMNEKTLALGRRLVELSIERDAEESKRAIDRQAKKRSALVQH